MTKIMTASIILDDVKAGKLNLSDEITVSEKPREWAVVRFFWTQTARTR